MADENVAVQLNDGGRIRLSGKDIKNEKDDAVVLVNMNRLSSGIFRKVVLIT